MSTPYIDPATAPFGFISSPSTATLVKVAAFLGASSTPVVGRMVYFDQRLDDGMLYRAIGTVTDVSTFNKTFDDALVLSAMARTSQSSLKGTDLKTLTLKIQAVYRATGEGESETWVQAGAGLPTSPNTLDEVRLVNLETLDLMLGDASEDLVYIGEFRNLPGVPLPLVIPDFSTRRGASHTAIIGRSGSGKTDAASKVLFAQMKNESHAIIVVDPQGQWTNEAGFTFSVQKAARALGREVTALRVSEDIRLPLRTSLLSALMDELRLWSALQRMGEENRQIFSDEVAKRIHATDGAADMDPRALLSKVFGSIASSSAAIGRIYARGGEQGENLKRSLCLLSGVVYYNARGEEELPSPDEETEAEDTWKGLLEKFTPLINLFSRTNLSGEPRRPLHGSHGFLSQVLQVRDGSNPAPYVILDMSSDVALSARTAYAKATKTSSDEVFLAQMRQLLDNPEIKALIVSTVLDEVKTRAEAAFAEGQGNLNTQIVFDEAWRYAPRLSSISPRSTIYALSEKLGGFALDTRKYGIGWTYILQSPSDLNETIWRQLSFIFTAYGIVGGDKRMLSDMMDDTDQMRLYEQFASPSSTGVYPFMINGPVNPLIFTNTPTFVNMFTEIPAFLEANATWIDDICDRRGMPRFSGHVETILPGRGPVGRPAARKAPKAKVAPAIKASPAISSTSVESDGSLARPAF